MFGRDFYRELMAVLHSISIDVANWPKPVEIPNPTPFPDDVLHSSYNLEAVSKDVRNALSPDEALRKFLRSTYEAGAITGNSDRSALERDMAATEDVNVNGMHTPE